VTHPDRGKALLDRILFQALFVIVLTSCAWYFQPMQVSPLIAAIGGALLALAILWIEKRIERIPIKSLIGGTGGGLIGILAAFLVSLVLSQVNPHQSPTLHFFELGSLLFLTYIGLAVGFRKGDALNLGVFGGLFVGETGPKRAYKILDTSVIIDGRIADIAETGFLDGALVIPQFVLRELQLVADSADSMKRNRGRRGLDVLQRLQKMSNLSIEIVEEDFPQVREVDMKLIELAKIYDCKIMTNDFNLNKVAQVRGVEVLNINELANSLKPIVLPGELMRVFILKEGKEYNQGVAYLDDGTMVVVDNARKMIAKTIDVSVTSVLQTTAGKMIFGKYDERLSSVFAERRDVPTAREGQARKEHAVGES
jgi:uncharacterized protein YacL